ncbi:MAG: UDP-glucose 4-epimerase GalE [Verrucomicrobiae bacterium]|nr:UDP-glucose 4-epimerase GalE [Verrucomicrobiae bacterium]
MRILVTGGAGYIGSVITEQLLEAGHVAIVYDNLSKGHRDAVAAGAHFVQGDLLERDRLLATLRETAVEAVVHMAADSLVAESVRNPAKYYRNNVGGGLSLLEAMREAGISKIVFSSTAAVYGEPRRTPIQESDPTEPTNPYGATKLAIEAALRWYGEAYGLRSVALRYFNAAGASERFGERHDPETHLIPLVLQAAAGEREAVTIFGRDYPTRDGTCIRDYIHVLDLAAAHIAALHALSENRVQRAAYNLGCGNQGYSVLEVIRAAEEATGLKVPVSEGARRPGDPAVLIAGADRIQSELGFRPRHQDLREIIASAWSWMRRTGPAKTAQNPSELAQSVLP